MNRLSPEMQAGRSKPINSQQNLEYKAANVSIDLSSNTDETSTLLQQTPEIRTRINANPKLSYLDGLRGLLCIIVVLSHTLLMGKSEENQPPSIFFDPWLHHGPLRIFIAGEFAVASFFVLSGFVLVRRYLDNPDQSEILMSGLIRRFPRLFIPSTVALFLYYAVLHFRAWPGSISCHEVGEGSVDAEHISLGYVVLNTFGQYFWMPALYTIQWTMQIEFSGSLIVYALAFLLNQSSIRRFRWFMYVLLVLILPIVWLASHGTAVPRPAQYVIPFLMGLLLSDLDASRLLFRFYSLRRPWSILVTIFLLLIVVYVGSYPVFNTDVIEGKGTLWSPLGWMFGWFWISVGSFCLLLLSLRSIRFQSFLSTRPIHFLGKISFGIYLLHYIVICFIDTTFIRFTAPSLHRDVVLVLGLLFLILPIVTAFAYLFYLHVDSPAVELSYWIYFLLFHRCSIMARSIKRPPPIQRRSCLVLLCFTILVFIISALPGQQRHRHCDNHSFPNVTLIMTA